MTAVAQGKHQIGAVTYDRCGLTSLALSGALWALLEGLFSGTGWMCRLPIDTHQLFTQLFTSCSQIHQHDIRCFCCLLRLFFFSLRVWCCAFVLSTGTLTMLT